MKKKTYISPSLIILIILIINFYSFSQNKPDSKISKRPSVGLVMSGGGAKGFAYIGLLKVIQEAGLRIDYIGGTSIGSIMAGLYAIGYAPDSIAKIIRSQNWDAIMQDKISRKYISFEEKAFGEKFIVSLPIKNKKIGLSASLFQGQNVNLMLNKYFSPAYNITNFNDLQTPFICIGTNLLNGDAVVLNKGYLPMAIRSSMSIPGYFSPTYYNGDYLVDGGVVDNYPVKQVKGMGAEIIVGLDVQSGLTKSIDKLNTITSVIDQIIAYHRVSANTEGYKLTNYYIPIKMQFGMMNFEDYDSIIAVGEKVGRKYFNKLKSLADSLNAIEFRPIKKYDTKPLDSVFVNKVIFRGYEKMPKNYFKNFFSESNNSYISFDEIERDINQMYGSGFFEHVFYKFEQENDNNNLILDIKEADPGYLSGGLHYDSDYLGSLFVNGVFRNVFGKRSKLFAELVLGSNPRLKTLYIIDNGTKLGFGVKLDMFSFDFDDYEKDVKVNSLNFTNYKASVFLNSVFKNLYNFRAGFEYEYFRFKQRIGVDTLFTEFQKFSSYGTVFASLNADTRNRSLFPTKGFTSEVRFEYIMPLSKNVIKDLFTNSGIAYMKYEHYLKLSDKFVLNPGYFVGITMKQDEVVPVQHLFAAGGLNPNNYIATCVDFTGLHFIQTYGYYMEIARMKLRYNFMKKMYLTLRTDAGANVSEFEDMYDLKNLAFGYGITGSYDSFIGPIQLSVMGSNLNSGVMLFLNLGFWF
ncbi:MAG: patatin-like phospholipase family protein [Bacteroidales bacterium]|nr:patatin-like phospholipase family protein [Bacteroidales bacterium]